MSMQVGTGDDKPTGRRDRLKAAKSRFDTQEAKEAIAQQARETLAWMRAREGSYTADGHLKAEPWWAPLPVTDNVALMVRRQRLLLDRAYEHSIFHTMFGLLKKGLIARMNNKDINLITTAMTPVVLNELAGFPLVGDYSFVLLSKLRELFGNGPNTKTASIRDRRLIPLSELGLLEGEECSDGYKIKIGRVGLVFFRDVYAPIVDETDIGFIRSVKK